MPDTTSRSQIKTLIKKKKNSLSSHKAPGTDVSVINEKKKNINCRFGFREPMDFLLDLSRLTLALPFKSIKCCWQPSHFLMPQRCYSLSLMSSFEFEARKRERERTSGKWPIPAG